ncbi:Heavy metal RND efflux outer membrane protein, CzcC family [hydrothermal vent metagenome]|uniref:Heavy metal RND efflux outer membrane protein, CzcC family n=1 Tax=hydrothermal vent metagenome TaxID=652676 RepID=A0A3B1APW2_9ZZZZ
MLPHKFVVFGFILSLFCSPLLAAVPSPDNPDEQNEAMRKLASALTVSASVEVAVADNPGLSAMRARAEAMSAIPSQLGTLPDPTLSFNALNLPVDTFNVGQEGMTQMQIGFGQKFPFPGKLGLREDAAGHEAKAAGIEVEESRLWLIRNVRSTWWRLFYVDQALNIINNNKVLLRQFVEIAQTKYKVGKGLQQDVLLAQLELSKLLDQEVQLSGMRRNEEARLNALLNWPTMRRLTLQHPIVLELPALRQERVLQKQAETLRPLLIAQQSRINAAHSRVALAKKDYYPDFNVGLAYGFRSGSNPDGSDRPDMASLRFSMNLPLYSGSKQDKAVDQRNSELLQQNYRLADAREQVHAQISQAMADYQRASEQVILFKTGIIPQSRQTVDSMLAGYQVNKVDFLNLVRAQLTLYNYEIQYWLSFSTAQQALAALEAVVGSETIYAGDNS